MVLFESTDTAGQIIQAINNLTGSTFITLLLLTTVCLLFFMALSAALGFGMPFEYSIILVLPMHLAILAYVANWMPVAGSFLIYLGLIIARNILRR